MYSNPATHADNQRYIYQKAKNALFEAEFQAEIERQIANKRTAAGKTLAEKTGALDEAKLIAAPKVHNQNKDEVFINLLTSSAYYFDYPTLEQE